MIYDAACQPFAHVERQRHALMSKRVRRINSLIHCRRTCKGSAVATNRNVSQRKHSFRAIPHQKIFYSVWSGALEVFVNELKLHITYALFLQQGWQINSVRLR